MAYACAHGERGATDKWREFDAKERQAGSVNQRITRRPLLSVTQIEGVVFQVGHSGLYVSSTRQSGKSGNLG